MGIFRKTTPQNRKVIKYSPHTDGFRAQGKPHTHTPYTTNSHERSCVLGDKFSIRAGEVCIIDMEGLIGLSPAGRPATMKPSATRSTEKAIQLDLAGIGA